MSQLTETAVKGPHSNLREKYGCLIGGEITGAESGKTFPTSNPATGEKLADVPDCDARDVSRAAFATSWRIALTVFPLSSASSMA